MDSSGIALHLPANRREVGQPDPAQRRHPANRDQLCPYRWQFRAALYRRDRRLRLATFDYNGDGKVDILFLNGAPLPGSPITTPPPRNALYRNEGGWKFTDVTLASGLGDTNYHLGVCVGDYNNDGFPDIYLNNFGPNILYRNNGDGTFTDVTREAGVAVGNHVGAGACFLDFDGDGYLDLFVANYVGFTFQNHQIGRASCRERVE